VGNYSLAVRRGEYEETHSVHIQREQQTEVKIDLNLGTAELLSDPLDAEFTMSGTEGHWRGKLPTIIGDVPVGNYSLVISRKGWEQQTDLSISRGVITTNKAAFPYGAIEVTSDPTGVLISTNGVDIGKMPTVLRELRPGQYTLTATDGDNDLSADVNVEPGATARYAFSFHYGKAQLISTPSGASVIRKGKEIGKTPLTLERIPAGETTVELQLDGYAPTSFPVQVTAGVTTSLTTKLISKRYSQAMKQAHEALDTAQYAEAQKFISAALETEPDDVTAISLRDEISKAALNAEEARREAERKAEEARKEMARKEITAIIEKAINAVGGRDAINQFRSFKAVYRESGKKNGTAFSDRVTIYMQLPDKIRLDREIPNEPKALRLFGQPVVSLTVNQGQPDHNILCVTGDGSWGIIQTPAGVVQQPVPQVVETTLRDNLYLSECTTFIPLLGPDYTLEKLADPSAVPYGAVAIKVHKAGKADVTLFFDKDSGFLLRLDFEEKNENGSTIHESIRYVEHHYYSGLLCPKVSTFTTDSNISCTSETESLEPMGPYYGNVFSAPPR
jgi:hypothetical protein